MEIKRFYDSALAHASYAIVSDGKIALVDPSRDPQAYYDFAAEKKAVIVAVLETHPHADFVSSHLQIHQDTGADIRINELMGVSYPHIPFNDGDTMSLGSVTIKALHTPGHSPDSNSYLLMNEQGEQSALFTGDFLFIGDIGRPDLREHAGNIQEAREDLARKMYQSIKNVLPNVADTVNIYQAHGAGTLCGKNLSDKPSDTLGNQRKTNWALQSMPEEEFVKTLLADQPFIPKYFTYDVEMNRKGADALEDTVARVPVVSGAEEVQPGVLIVDTRDEPEFKKGHLPHSINIQCGPSDKFETWLGSIVDPGEEFYVVAASEEQKNEAVRRAAKIGYESQIKGALVSDAYGSSGIKALDIDTFAANKDDYYIVDVRQLNEHEDDAIFADSLHIPLAELRERAGEIQTSKPVVIHCAGGYRSAVGASVLSAMRPDLTVYDLGVAVHGFKGSQA